MDQQYSFCVLELGERTPALQLIRENYLRDLGHFPVDGFDDAAIFIAASTLDGRMIGALRYLPPNVRPFDFESFVDLAPILSADRIPALIGRMAVDPGHRAARRGHIVQLGLLREACSLSRKLQVTDLLLYAYPKLAKVYRNVLFEPLHASFYHPTAGSLMELLRLDLTSLYLNHALSRTGRFLIGGDAGLPGD